MSETRAKTEKPPMTEATMTKYSSVPVSDKTKHIYVDVSMHIAPYTYIRIHMYACMYVFVYASVKAALVKYTLYALFKIRKRERISIVVDKYSTIEQNYCYNEVQTELTILMAL